VVEDSTLVRDALRVLLESTGHRVSDVGTLEDAVATATRDEPDLILLDLTLPDGDGLALIGRLAPGQRKRPVYVALTGRDDPSERTRCLSAGCADVLLKPVPVRALVASVRQWLSEPVS